MPEGEGAAATSLAVRQRSLEPARFSASLIDPFVELLTNDLGPEALERAQSCDFAYVITAELDDPDDLGHLQAAWAIAKCICEQPGAEIVIDVHAARAHLAADIAALGPARPFELLHEISLLFDTIADGTVAAWTTGMRKVGRPDLVFLGLPSEESTDAAVALRDLAAMLAAGERIEPGDVVSNDGLLYEARALPPHLADLVDGDAVWLCPSPGAE